MEAAIRTRRAGSAPLVPAPSFPCTTSTPCTQSLRSNPRSNPSAAQMLKQTLFHLISKSHAPLDPLHPVSGMGFQNISAPNP